MGMNFEKALEIALRAHKGQKDLDGNQVIIHPVSVAVRVKDQGESAMIVAVLHDVAEDTNITLEDLRLMGASKEVLEALQLLTHNKDMSYRDYIERIVESGNELALRVKMADLEHNLERGISGGHTKQVNKHSWALNYIKLSQMLR